MFHKKMLMTNWKCFIIYHKTEDDSAVFLAPQDAASSVWPEYVQQHGDSHRGRGLQHPQVSLQCVWYKLSEL